MGIIDRDFRPDEEIAARRKSGVSVLDVAEVEHLLCIPEVVKAVGKQLEMDPEEAYWVAEKVVIGELASEYGDPGV